MKTIAIIPALNEEKTIGRVIQGVKEYVNGVIVVNDGSTDNTVSVARKHGADEIITHKINKGLGTAFKTGIETALKKGADIIVNVDADGQFNPKNIPKLIQPIIDQKADIVTCSRFLDKKLEPDMPWIKKFGNKLFTKLINFLTKKNFTDTQCGFRAYSREAALRMTLFGNHTYTQEVFLDLVNKGLQIVEVPCKIKGEREGKSRVVHSITLYSLKALMIITRSIRDYEPLKFFGSVGTSIFSIGALIGMGVFIRWLMTGLVSPYKSLVDLSVLFIVIGFMIIVLALIADMSDRQRKLQEEILYELRKQG